jgi:chromosome condensin MukBEF ATPase and DNA-binding subunit MukB
MVDKDRLDRIEDKLDKLTEKLQETNVILAENTKSLIIHEKRTDIAENKLNLLEVQFKEYITRDRVLLDKIETKLEPIHNHVTAMNIILKYIIPALTGLLVFFFKIGVLKY